MQFHISFRRKTGKEIRQSSRLEFSEKFSQQITLLYLMDAEDNTSGPLNRGGIANLPLLRTLLAIRQKSREPRFWEVMESLVAYASRMEPWLPWNFSEMITKTIPIRTRIVIS